MYERRLCVEQPLSLRPVELTDIHATDIWRPRCVIEEVFAVREKPWTAMNGLSWCQLRQGDRFSAGSGTRIRLPWVAGLRPRPASRMAFSMA